MYLINLAAHHSYYNKPGIPENTYIFLILIVYMFEILNEVGYSANYFEAILYYKKKN